MDHRNCSPRICRDPAKFSSCPERIGEDMTHELPNQVLNKDMNIQSIREHVQLIIDDAKQSSTERTSAGMHISGADHLGYLYAQIQGLGKMMLEILDYLGMMGAK